MIKHLLALGAFAILPVAAMGNCTSSSNPDMLTLNIPTGQGGQYRLTIPSHANAPESVEAPFALTGTSSTEIPHHYRLMVVGQGGMVRIQMD
jgi:hypothetical protein